MTRAIRPGSGSPTKAPAVNDALRAKRLRTLAALAGRIDLRYTNDELEAMEEELQCAIE